MSPAQARVLLAAVASPLRQATVVGAWNRTDAPALAIVAGGEVWSLVQRGLLEWGRHSSAMPTPDGRAEAETLRAALGRDKRELLRQIDEAGELVRRRRPARVEEICSILATGDPAGDTIEEWVLPADGWRAAEIVADGVRLAYLVERGLVVLLAGGTRAVLTGAGRWCAEPAPVTCAACGGAGEVRHTRPDGDEVGVCSACDGDGEIVPSEE